MSTVLSLKPSYYDALKRLTLELAGVHLGDDHAFLVETRLGSLARAEGYTSLNQMIDDLFGQGQTRLAIKVVSSLLERDTHFNPDPISMATLESHILPALYAREGSPKIRILSFACSSGQEPYSLAILANRFLKTHPNVDVKILGVDYPSPALSRAKAGKYTHFEVQRGLGIQDLITNFDRVGEDWVVKAELRAKVEFKEYHLLSKLDSLGQFDVILFRNSLAHYSSPARIRVVRSLSAIVKEEGYLLFGAEEVIPRVSFSFDTLPDHPHVLKKLKEVIEETEPEEVEVPKAPPQEYIHGAVNPARKNALPNS